MGRHTAADETSVHPLVAEGMARRISGSGSHRTADERSPHAVEVGWPEPPRKGEGLGWPGDLSPDERPPAEPVPQSRRGWRRLFGADPAA